jgi:predicted NAD/FAD-dependent oxidoreductase
VLGAPPARADAAELASAVRAQLGGWFGPAVSGWKYLKSFRIQQAQPDQAPPALRVARRPVRLQSGLYVCGDHRDDASINGALRSGRRAAEAVLEQLSLR